MTKLFNIFKKTLFLALFWGKKFFSKKPDCCTQLHMGSSVPRKCLDRWKDGQKDGRTDRTYFLGPFLQRWGSNNGSLIFFKLGFTPCKAEQPLRDMELQGKEAQKD